MKVKDFCGDTHTNVRLTYRPDKNGALRWQRQCMDCGYSVGNFIRRTDAEREAGQLFNIPAFDEGLVGRNAEALQAERLNDRAKWWAWYSNYLKSDGWKQKAAAVHRRAKCVCEGCGQAPSRQIHHLTYEHAGNEFLWELVAVCDDCHERAHAKDGPQE